MSLSDALHILLGAALVSVGVLTAALAERIRGNRVDRFSEAPARRPNLNQRLARVPRAQRERTMIPVVQAADLVQPAAKPRVSGGQPKASSGESSGDEVIAALVGTGYSKKIATEATWSCEPTERRTVEAWTAAALRRCASGAAS